MSDPTICASLREAINVTAVRARIPMKALAAELDWSPSELSMRTTLGGDSARAFPADDEHLVKLMRVTQDYSVLATLADQCGFEIQPKRERTAELLHGLQADIKALMPRIQMVLELSGEPGTKGEGRKAAAR